jgi:hypothetical protein
LRDPALRGKTLSEAEDGCAVAEDKDDDDDEGPLTAEEIKTLKLMAKYWAGINTVSQIASTLGSVGKWIMYLYAIYIAIRLGVLDKFLVGSGGDSK